MIRKSLRDKVFRRDRGVCAQCGNDTEALRKDLDELRRVLVAAHGQKDGRKRWADGVKAAGFIPGRSYWEADHKVALEEGGEDDVENLQTLCRKCHTAKTRTHLGRKAKRERLATKAIPKPAPVKLASKARKAPNVQQPGKFNRLGG